MRTPVEKHCYFAYSVVIRLSLVCVVAAAVFVVELPPSSLSFTPCVEDPRTLLSRFLPFGLCKHVAAVSLPSLRRRPSSDCGQPRNSQVSGHRNVPPPKHAN